MLYWKIEEKKFSLKYLWKISRNESSAKINFIIHCGDGTNTGRGEVAPNIRYGETISKLLHQFKRFCRKDVNKLKNLNQLDKILNENEISNSLRFGIESSFINYYCSKNNIDIFSFLGLKKRIHVPTFYSIPIMEKKSVLNFYNKHKLERFKILKVKVNSDLGTDLVNTVLQIHRGKIVIDGNECFKSVNEVIGFINTIPKNKILFIEQPFSSLELKLNRELRSKINIPLFADESLARGVDIKILKKNFDGVNVKLMKAGGYREGIRQLKEAKIAGMKTMIGCMIESSLGIRSALYLSCLADYIDLDGFLVIKDEPFELVKEHKGKLNIIE